MTLIQLYYFINVVQYSSITKAANIMHVTHSTVSRSISELEEELKVRLLFRSNKNILPTEAGLVLLEHSKRITNDVEAMKKDMKKLSSMRETCLRVALPSLATGSPILKGINDFKKKYPDVSLAFEDLDLDAIEKELQHDKVDLVISYSFVLEKINIPLAKYTIQDLYEETIVALVGNHSAEADFDELDVLEHKMKHPLMLQNAGSEFMDEKLPPTLFDLHRNPYHAEKLALNSIILSVMNGAGWACLPECVAERFSDICTIIPLKNIDTRHHITMCWRREPKNPILNKLAKCVIEEVKCQ